MIWLGWSVEKEAVDAQRWADALIEIAAAFTYDKAEDTVSCDHCFVFMWGTCTDDCPGLLARKALGVA